ncbi:MAG: hypothetical protein AAB618_00480 [Patescibacteria group bacterium]
MTYINDDIEGEEEEIEDDDTVSLADDVLDEVDGDDDELAADMEGFGLLEEVAEKEEVEEEEDLDGDESLEEDAEDVDYDSFDDIDEM